MSQSIRCGGSCGVFAQEIADISRLAEIDSYMSNTYQCILSYVYSSYLAGSQPRDLIALEMEDWSVRFSFRSIHTDLSSTGYGSI